MAAKRRQKKSKTIPITNNKYLDLCLSDVICSVCKGILIEPVSLPCNHSFCVKCFEASMEETNLVCPLCRTRIGSWLRRARKTRTLVNEQYWQAIKEQFPRQIQNKQNDINEDLLAESPKLNIAEPGEIRKEFELEKEKQLELLKKKREEDLKASEDLIKKIQEEEAVNASKTCDNNLSVSFNSPSTSKCKTGPIDRYLRENCERKTFTYILNLDKSKKQLKNQTVQKIIDGETCRDSSDSIESECRYFKPIDYRHNPPADIKSPLKVSAKKQTQIIPPKIMYAPNGVNNFTSDWQTSAFASIKSKMDNQTNNLKRKHSDNSLSPNKKHHTSFHIKNFGERVNNCDKKRLLSNQLINIDCSSENRNNNNNGAINDEKQLQEKADFEFALKLQNELNRTHHLTRRRVAASKNLKGQLTLDEILVSPYKVK